jgi:16S rRNA C967 or C1407 C5-methylase (RsmB/RsmF family)
MEKNDINGFVVANDVDRKRANMLIHQLERIPTASMMTVNHFAQFFPTIFS